MTRICTTSRLCGLFAVWAAVGGLVAGSATAAGAAPAAPLNWTGLYVGGNASLSGGQFSQTWSDFGVPYATDHAQSSGFSGGGEAGFNFQPAGSNWVAGFEADIQASTIKGTYADLGPTFHSGTAIDWWGTARGRLGYAMGQVLPYVTGGLAYGHLTNSYTDTASIFVPGGYDETWSSTQLGWTLGAGVEAAVTRNLSVKAEYLYTNFSWTSEDPQNAVAYPGEFSSTVNGGFSTARIGLNWKLN